MDIISASITLYDAVIRRDVQTVTSFLQNGYDPNLVTIQRSGKFVTLLHIAIKIGVPDLVETLLNADADVNAPDWISRTPLHYCMTSSHANKFFIAEQLLNKGSGIDNKDRYSRTPLHASIRDIQSVKFLLEHGAVVNTINSCGATPLCSAIFQRHKKLIELLLAHGANPNMGDVYHCGPLMQAIGHNSVEMVTILLKYKANPNIIDIYGNTPLHYATADNKNAEIVKTLLEYGADPNITTEDGITPLHIAARNNIEASVIYLLQYDAKVDILPDNNATSPLCSAVINANLNIVSAIMEMNPKLLMGKYNNPISLAIKQGHLEILVAIITNLKTIITHYDALLEAVRVNNVYAVKLLLNHGIILHALDFYEHIPLQTIYTTQSGRKNIIQILILHTTMLQYLDRRLYTIESSKRECISQYLRKFAIDSQSLNASCHYLDRVPQLHCLKKKFASIIEQTVECYVGKYRVLELYVNNRIDLSLLIRSFHLRKPLSAA